ncbi:hypothetical protein [Bradyrhizobium sp. SZCCHNR1075]|uniref:hypothetical protein n=1 Tax=Bradyrhizobium sp. SZCCHNR1075 TaxID=3057362 RepID=UPI0028E9F49F|nr:hypothetical protein [Bradyrhizobium sp. SZCCHNR1075]
MSHKFPLDVLGAHFTDVQRQGMTPAPGCGAVLVEAALARAGLTIVSTDVVAALAAIVTHGSASVWQVSALLTRLGLAKIVPYDPVRHDAGGAEIEEGAEYLEYSDALKMALRRSAQTLHGAMH